MEININMGNIVISINDDNGDFFNITINDETLSLQWNKENTNTGATASSMFLTHGLYGTNHLSIPLNGTDFFYQELLTLVKDTFIRNNKKQFDTFLDKAYKISDLSRQRKIDKIIGE